jgi:hypothetical protein
VSELCQFLGGGWKVILAIKQHSQPLFTVRNRGGEVIFSKKYTHVKVEGSKKRFKKKKIPDCGPTSAVT